MRFKKEIYYIKMRKYAIMDKMKYSQGKHV